MLTARMSNIPKLLWAEANSLSYFDQGQQKLNSRVSLPRSVQHRQGNNSFIWYRVTHTNKQRDDSLCHGPKYWMSYHSSMKTMSYWVSAPGFGMRQEKDKRIASDTAELLCASLLTLLLQMDRSPQGPAEVGRLQISIGNHSPTCFLKVSAYQQQKLCGRAELNLTAFSLRQDTFNNKESEGIQGNAQLPHCERTEVHNAF